MEGCPRTSGYLVSVMLKSQKESNELITQTDLWQPTIASQEKICRLEEVMGPPKEPFVLKLRSIPHCWAFKASPVCRGCVWIKHSRAKFQSLYTQQVLHVLLTILMSKTVKIALKKEEVLYSKEAREDYLHWKYLQETQQSKLAATQW